MTYGRLDMLIWRMEGNRPLWRGVIIIACIFIIACTHSCVVALSEDVPADDPASAYSEDDGRDAGNSAFDGSGEFMRCVPAYSSSLDYDGIWSAATERCWLGAEVANGGEGLSNPGKSRQVDELNESRFRQDAVKTQAVRAYSDLVYGRGTTVSNVSAELSELFGDDKGAFTEEDVEVADWTMFSMCDARLSLPGKFMSFGKGTFRDGYGEGDGDEMAEFFGLPSGAGDEKTRSSARVLFWASENSHAVLLKGPGDLAVILYRSPAGGMPSQVMENLDSFESSYDGDRFLRADDSLAIPMLSFDRVVDLPEVRGAGIVDQYEDDYEVGAVRDRTRVKLEPSESEPIAAGTDWERASGKKGRAFLYDGVFMLFAIDCSAGGNREHLDKLELSQVQPFLAVKVSRLSPTPVRPDPAEEEPGGQAGDVREGEGEAGANAGDGGLPGIREWWQGLGSGEGTGEGS